MTMNLIKTRTEGILRQCMLEHPDNPEMARASAVQNLVEDMKLPEVAAAAFVARAQSVCHSQPET